MVGVYDFFLPALGNLYHLLPRPALIWGFEAIVIGGFYVMFGWYP